MTPPEIFGSPSLGAARVGARPRIPLSAPHLTGHEVEAVARAVATNWIAPIGPEIAAFEEEFARALGTSHALATNSGTSAIHLGLRVLGVGAGDEVLVSTLTFCASVNPIIYQGAKPVFVDSDARSWNMDSALLARELDARGRAGRLPKAVLVVHLYGQVADMTPILAACDRWGVPVLEDAAEGLGTTHDPAGAARAAGTLGTMGAFSFDGAKMITTSMGGMLISDRADLVQHARKLAGQAREPVSHYEHTEVGYNYRMSNLLAAFGRVQLGALPERVAARRAVGDAYEAGLASVPGVTLQEEVPWGRHSRWLSCILLDEADPERLRVALAAKGIESRRIWKPMHQQPVYQGMKLEVVGGAVADDVFARGLCLPSTSTLTGEQVAEVCDAIRTELARG